MYQTWQNKANLYALSEALRTTGGKPLATQTLPGPTGELNQLRLVPRDPILCLGPGEVAQAAQIDLVRAIGGQAIGSEGHLNPDDLTHLSNVSGVIYWGEDPRPIALALANRAGPIVPLILDTPDIAHAHHERHLCIDTTAAGGNAALLAG